jgi:hypothetical protein
MCDFRLKRRGKIDLMDISGWIILSGSLEDKNELDPITGTLELEKTFSPPSYNVVVTIFGSDTNSDDIIVSTTAKFPTRICPNCGKVLSR